MSPPRLSRDGRHAYEEDRRREELERLEQQVERLWITGEINDTEEENPRAAALLRRRDELERECYPHLGDAFNLDDEEDWDGPGGSSDEGGGGGGGSQDAHGGEA